MAVPKRRTSNSRQGHRRSANTRLTAKQIQYCGHCNEPVLPHHVCPNCGFYQNREIVRTENDEEK